MFRLNQRWLPRLLARFASICLTSSTLVSAIAEPPMPPAIQAPEPRSAAAALLNRASCPTIQPKTRRAAPPYVVDELAECSVEFLNASAASR